ncbi:MAG TPA: aldose 1-epimerase [Burkholderiales bacterium]|nr:aldose 1-epimerase [Burkholderiales bacterium]
MSALLALAAGPLVAELAPEIGGSVARFYSRGGEELVHWMRPAGAAALAARDPLAMASFPLLPFSNRIRNGRFHFGSTAVTLPRNFPGSPHAIHGDGWRLAWRVVAHSDASATLALEHPRGDWPFAYRAEQHFALTPSAFEVTLAVTNIDERPMPLGIGQHPYFPRTPGAVVRTSVEAMWESDAELLPTRLARNEVVAELARGLRPEARFVDNNFTGWQGEATVRWPETGHRLRLRAEPPLSYFVLYTPAGEDFFCMEPVSNCTDWLNLGHLDPKDVGGAVLAPGERLAGRMRLEPDYE